MQRGKFLRLSINDSYNRNMNSVDIADQLRGSYRPDRWMRKMKWWWSMFFWGHGTMLVNAFLCYKRHMEINGKTPMKHMDFREAVVLAKINPEKYGPENVNASVAIQRGDYRAHSRGPSQRSRDSADDDTTTTRGAAREKDSKKMNKLSSVQLEHEGSMINIVRLDKVIRHLPVPADRSVTNGISCQLCRWATGKKHSKQLLKCGDCGFHLCAWCYEPFHTVSVFDRNFQKVLAQKINERNPRQGNKVANATNMNKMNAEKKAVRSKRKS